VITKKDERKSPVSFVVEVASPPSGCEAVEGDPCPYSMDEVTIEINVIARGPNGGVDTDFDDTVMVSLVPSGILPREGQDVHTLPDGTKALAVPLTAGQATNVPVSFKAAFGSVQLFAEDLGYRPMLVTNECRANGVGCPACYGYEVLPSGCLKPDDDNPHAGYGAAGVTRDMVFDYPTIADTQRVEDTPDAIDYSPLAGFRVHIDGNHPSEFADLSDCVSGGVTRELMVVTAVTADGFYVTDVCNNGGPVHAPDTWRDFGSIFSFNFHAPEDLETGDCIEWLQGGSNDFYGFTELKNPAWSPPACLEGSEGCQPACLDFLPEPLVLDAQTLGDDYSMEMLEGSLVAVQGGTIGMAESCDFNGNGQIDFEDAAEKQCKYDCDDDPGCWLLESYRDYFQFTVSIGNAEIAVVTRGVVAFEPLEHQGETLQYVAGTIKHLSFGGPPWIMSPRNEDDFEL
jgi:hypothetical protein